MVRQARLIEFIASFVSGNTSATLVLQNPVFPQDLHWHCGGSAFSLEEVVKIEVFAAWPAEATRPALGKKQVQDIKLRRTATKCIYLGEQAVGQLAMRCTTALDRCVGRLRQFTTMSLGLHDPDSNAEEKPGYSTR